MPEPVALKCYLCGGPLDSKKSADHVPPKQVFAPSLRKAHDLQLLTIPAHAKCNLDYQRDEDYFVHSLVPFIRGTIAGRALYDEVLAKFKANKKVGLTTSVLEEFQDRTPGGLVLPSGKVVKRFNRKRIDRIAWKIVRGLYFYHHKTILPIDLQTFITMTPVSNGEQPPAHFLEFMQHSQEMFGKYPGVFSYRFNHFTEDGAIGANIHYWALLFWDSVLITVMFHHGPDRTVLPWPNEAMTVPYPS